MIFTVGQVVTIIGLPYTIIGPGQRAGLIRVQRDSDGAEIDVHPHSIAEHPINGGGGGD